MILNPLAIRILLLNVKKSISSKVEKVLESKSEVGPKSPGSHVLLLRAAKSYWIPASTCGTVARNYPIWIVNASYPNSVKLFLRSLLIGQGENCIYFSKKQIPSSRSYPHNLVTTSQRLKGSLGSPRSHKEHKGIIIRASGHPLISASFPGSSSALFHRYELSSHNLTGQFINWSNLMN